MTLSKALSIFGIKGKYTEEEIKKIYINLIKQYHPDKYERESQKLKEQMTSKTQEINEAYDLLKKNITNQLPQENTYETANSYWSGQRYQGYGYHNHKTENHYNKKTKEIQEKIREYFKYCSAKKLTHQVVNLINNYINQTEYSQTPDLIFINFKISLETLYKNYINTYAKKHQIPLFLINKYNFNYDCDCAKLFSQIQECERIVEVDLSKIIRKYKCHEHFDILEHKIVEEKDRIRKKIRFNTISEEYLKILETYNNIVNKLIIDYSMKYYEFKFALNKISRQLTESIKKELYKNIKLIVLNADDDEMTELLISAIEESNTKKEDVEQIKIAENYCETQKKENENGSKKMQKIREIVYKELKEKYLTASKNKILEIELINNLFIKAVELLYNETCTIGTLAEIKKITFENPQEEYEKIAKLSVDDTRECSKKIK